MKKPLKIIIVLLLCIVLTAAQGICEPKEKSNNGKKDQNAAKTNNGNANKGQNNNGKSNNGKQHKGKSDDKKIREAFLNKKNTKHAQITGPDIPDNFCENIPGSGIKEAKLAKLIQSQQRSNRFKETPKEKVERYKNLLKAMERSRWAYNPHDGRGQGNNSKNDMLDPFGHDKDSDRKELYGNNGRKIRHQNGDDTDSENPPDSGGSDSDNTTEEPAALEASIDFTSISEMQWLVNWYESTLAKYYLDATAQKNYTYEEWEAMWHDHFFPGGDLGTATGIRINTATDTADRFFFDILLPDFQGDTVEVTTQMILTQPHTTTQQYDEATGMWIEQTVELLPGEVVYEVTKTALVDPAAGSVNVGIAATNDLLGYSDEEAYINLIVTVADPATGSTYTQTYDKALYLYRCPYGKIYDSGTSRPIVNAKVTVHFEDGSVVPLDRASNPTASNPQVTDATGRYGFKLETNRKYYMTATADGYEDYKSPVFTEKWHVLREDISLTPEKTTEAVIGQNNPSR